MRPHGTRQSQQSVSGPQQSHQAYIRHVRLRDMKQHAMGSASLSTMLLLRECAFQEEGQGPWGHKAWLMAKKCFSLHTRTKVFILLHIPLPSIIPLFQQHCSALLSFQQHAAGGERLPEPGRVVLLHRGKGQPGLSLSLEGQWQM